MSLASTKIRLEPYCQSGQLKLTHCAAGYGIYDFQNLVSVGFLWDAPANEPTGILLTPGEVAVLSKWDQDDLFKRLHQQAIRNGCVITFSQDNLRKYQSFWGKFRLRQTLKKHSYQRQTEDAPICAVTEKPDTEILASSIETIKSTKKRLCDIRRKTEGIFWMLWVAIAACLIVSGIILGTNDARNSQIPNKTYASFDKNGQSGAYVSLKIDIAALLTDYTKPDPNHPIGRTVERYYLIGNTKTGQYGVARIQDDYSIDWEDGSWKYFPEEIPLYGTAQTMPGFVGSTFEPYTPPSIEVPGNSITLPNGTTVTTPPQTITVPTVPSIPSYNSFSYTDYSRKAWEIFAEHGLTPEGEKQLGLVYIYASTTPEKAELPANDFFKTTAFIFPLLCVLLTFFLVKQGLKRSACEKTILRLNGEAIMWETIERHSPVLIKGKNIYLNSDALIQWTKLNHAEAPEYEYRKAMYLTEKTPVLYLYDDGSQTREYRLQTVGAEDFSGKFFHISIRLRIATANMLPVAQIDGFLSDSAEETPISDNHICYRIEGYFLRSPGAAAQQIYNDLRGQDLVAKGLKYDGYANAANVRLIGFCPACRKSFTFHGHSFYMTGKDVAYSDDGLDICVISQTPANPQSWMHLAGGKAFRYYNSFCCPHCKAPYIDYRRFPHNKQFGVPGCVHLGRKPYECGK